MNEIEKFKNTYIRIPESKNPLEGWGEIEGKLGKQSSIPPFRPSYLQTFIMGLILFSFISVGTTQAKPGDKLYPIRVFTDNTLSTITKNPENKVKKRVDDIIKASEDPKKLDTAVRYYQQTLEDVEKKVQKPQEKQKINQVIKKQEIKLEEASKNNPTLFKKLPEIINEPKNVEGETKGVKTENNYNNRLQNSQDKPAKKVKEEKSNSKNK